MRFDYYSATVPANPDVILGEALHVFDMSSFRPCKPVNGYERAGEIFRGDEVLSRLYWGGVNGDDESHMLASGARSPALASFLRDKFKDHRVSRADICVDFNQEGSWDHLTRPAFDLIKQRKMNSSTVGDWITPGSPAGRTLYVGSRTSDAYMRIYEKGKQLCTDPHHVRAELVCQPHKRPLKERLATLEPLECWGSSRWSRQYLEAITGQGVQPLPRSPEEPTDDDRATNAICRQYGGLLRRLADKVGGFASLGLHLEHLLELQEQEENRRKVFILPTDTKQLSLDFAKQEPKQGALV